MLKKINFKEILIGLFWVLIVIVGIALTSYVNSCKRAKSFDITKALAEQEINNIKLNQQFEKEIFIQKNNNYKTIDSILSLRDTTIKRLKKEIKCIEDSIISASKKEIYLIKKINIRKLKKASLDSCYKKIEEEINISIDSSKVMITEFNTIDSILTIARQKADSLKKDSLTIIKNCK